MPTRDAHRPRRKTARGAHTAGVPNDLEAAYAAAFLAPRVASGEVTGYSYEPDRLRLCHLYTYCPDWRVDLADGSVEYHEIKGWRIEPGALSKVRIAAALYPDRKFFVCQARGKKWRVTAIPNAPAGPLEARP